MINKTNLFKILYMIFALMTVPVLFLAYNKLDFSMAFPFVMVYIIFGLFLSGITLVIAVKRIYRMPSKVLYQRLGRSLLYFIGISIFLGTLKIIFQPEVFDLNKLLIKSFKIALGLTFADLFLIQNKTDTQEE